VITSVGTVGGFPDLAPNGWTQIKGSGLAPLSVPRNGVVWNDAPEFRDRRMPTQLADVNVTVNGRLAFVFYVSANQVNVLLPLDTPSGPVTIVLENSGNQSPPFPAIVRTAAPSLPSAIPPYPIALHTDFSLVGPATLSVSGYTYTPAAPGELIVLYGFGFGLPENALVNGADTQFGRLAELPQFTIGGLPAVVEFAGVVSPGLYQFNVRLNPGVQNGDNTITCFYKFACGLDGSMLTVRR